MADPASNGFGSPYPVLTQQPIAPQQARGMPPPRPTGPNGMMGYVEAPFAGAYEAAGTLGSAAQAAAKLVGADNLADAAKAWADRQRATAATYQSPDLEQSPWYSPGGIAYRVLKGVPAAAGMLGAGMVAGALAPEEAVAAGAAPAAIAAARAISAARAAKYGMAAAGVTGYPLSVGSNVETSEATNGPLTSGQAGWAAALGVPEAALGAWPMGRLSGALERGVAAPFAKTVATDAGTRTIDLAGGKSLGGYVGAAAGQAGVQALAGAGQNLIAQQMNDRSIPFNMQEMMSSALTGGVTGALMGTGVHAFAKTHPADVTETDMGDAIDQATKPQPLLLPPPAVRAGPPLDAMSNEELVTRARAAHAGNTAELPGLLQEMMRRAGPSGGPEPQQGEPIIPQPSQNEMDLATRHAQDRPVGEPGVQVGDIPNFAVPEHEQETAVEPAKAAEPAPSAKPPPEPAEPAKAAEPAEPAEPAVSPRTPEAVLADVLKVTRMKKPPFWLKDTSSDEAVQQQVREHAGPQTEDSPPLKGAARNIADKYGMLDAKGKLIPEKTSPEEPVSAPADAVATAKSSLDALRVMNVAKPGISTEAAKNVNAEFQSALVNDPSGELAGKLDINTKAQAALQTHVDNVRAALQPIHDLVGATQSPLRDAAISAAADRYTSVHQTMASDPDLHPTIQADSAAKLAAIQPVIDEAHRTGDWESVNNALPANRQVPDTRTPAAAGVERIAQAGGSLKDAAALIQRTGSTGLYKTAAKLLVDNGVDASIQTTPARGEFVAGARGRYYPGENKIGVFSADDLEHTVLHEGIHAGTLNAINAKTPAGKEMIQLHQWVVDHAPGAQPEGKAYGLKDAGEFASEINTNQQFRDFVDTIPANPSLPGRPRTVLDAFKNIVARIFGAKNSIQRTALDQATEITPRLMRENAGLSRSPGDTADLRTPQGQNDTTKATMAAVDAVKEKFDEVSTAAPSKIQHFVNGFRAAVAIAHGYRDTIPSATRFVLNKKTAENYQNGWNSTDITAVNKQRALSAPEKAQFKTVTKAMALGKIDPREPWGNQDSSLAKDPSVATWQKIHADAYRVWNAANPAVRDAVQAHIDARHTHAIAVTVQMLDKRVKSAFPELAQDPAFGGDPSANHQMNADAHDNNGVAKQAWMAELTPREAAARAYVNADAMVNKGEPSEKVKSIVRYLSDIDTLKKDLVGVPNLKLGHGKGQYFVAGGLKIGADGLPDKTALAAVQARLAKDGFHIGLDATNATSKIFARIETQSKAEDLRKAFEDLQDQGHLDKDVEIARGSASEAARHGIGPAAMHDMIEELDDGRPALPPGTDQKIVDQVNAAWNTSKADIFDQLMDVLPNSSPLKIFSHKEYVQGYNEDMAESFAQNIPATSRMHAVLGTALDKGQALAGMRKELDAYKHTKGVSVPDAKAAQDAIDEIMLREAKSPLSQPNGFIRAIQGLTQRWEIGTSVPYFTTLQTQHFTMTLPEFGKSHGYKNAFEAFVKTTTPSWQVIRAMLKDPNWTQAGVRLNTLTKAGIDPALARKAVYFDNLGVLMQSAYTHAIAPEETGGGFMATAANVSSAMSRFAEVQPRLQAALMADKLYRPGKDGDYDTFIRNKVNGAQLDWGAGSTARQFTAGGELGQAGPLMNLFMGYRARYTEKMYQEFHELFAGKTPADKLAAGKYLAGHLAAVTVLAGAMGLPSVAVFASVYDKLADTLTGNPSHDIMDSFRHYLTSAYGPTLGTAMARGVPAAMGVDMSRVGDQKIIPGSDLVMAMTEKRKFQDAESDWLRNLAGSGVGLLANFAMSAYDIANGDYLNGAIKMSPEAFRGPTEALRDTLIGWRNKAGTSIGITPNGIDIALTAMGFDPAKMETYELNRGVYTGLESRRQTLSQTITQHLAKAYQLGDPRTFQYWAGRSDKYMHDYPGMAPPLADLDRFLNTQMMEGAMAQQSGVMAKPRNLSVYRGMGML